MHTFSVTTHKKREIIDITDRIDIVLRERGVRNGVCTIFVQHTTAAIMIADLDPGGTDLDYLDVFEKLVPIPVDGFRHPHDPAHMPDHILASLIGPSVVIPIKEGALTLGTWQKVVLVELSGLRERSVVISVIMD